MNTLRRSFVSCYRLSQVRILTNISCREFSVSSQPLRVIFRQLFDSDTCTYTYIIGCPKTDKALIIDPVYEFVDRDLQVLSQLNLKPTFAINTHVHADHVTGSGKMKAIVGPTLRSVIGSESGADADQYIHHDEELECGTIKVEARSTPGHTNGCMTYVLHQNQCAFTGDALLIRGCGRTDFQQGDPGKLYDSVHKYIFSLPDHYSLYPAHDYTGQTATTVMEELQFNKRLNLPKKTFIDMMNNLGLAYPRHIDKSLPANLKCGIFEDNK